MTGRAESIESNEPESHADLDSELPTDSDCADGGLAADADVDGAGELAAADGEDATMPAAGDVVAKIRAHAAQARSSAASRTDGDAGSADMRPASTPRPADQLADAERVEAGALSTVDDSSSVPVWTPSAVAAEPSTPSGGDKSLPQVPLDVLAPGPPPDVLDELVDVTIPFDAAARVGRTAPVPTGDSRPGSLIAGQTPPEAATSFWGPDDTLGAKPFRASGMPERQRRSARRSPLPLWVIVAVVAVAIVVASVVIALVVTSGAQP